MKLPSRHIVLLLVMALALLAANARAAEVMPPPPAAYFNDYAKVVDPAAAAALNDKLAKFEADTSNQVFVAIFPKMESDSSIEDYTVRVAQSWRVGQKVKKNGVVLFVFIQDRKMYIQVGYGLEGALPDVTCKRIIEDEIQPSFKHGEYTQGIQKGVDAILAATKGEYKGTGSKAPGAPSIIVIIFIAIFVLMFLGGMARSLSGSLYDGRRGSSFFSGLLYFLAMFASSSSSSRGSSWGGGGGWSSGGGGGGFSGGGGGSFGGGGAGGSW